MLRGGWWTGVDGDWEGEVELNSKRMEGDCWREEGTVEEEEEEEEGGKKLRAGLCGEKRRKERRARGGTGRN